MGWEGEGGLVRCFGAVLRATGPLSGTRKEGASRKWGEVWREVETGVECRADWGVCQREETSGFHSFSSAVSGFLRVSFCLFSVALAV